MTFTYIYGRVGSPQYKEGYDKHVAIYYVCSISINQIYGL